MRIRKYQIILLVMAFLSGLLLWAASNALLGVSEPWDSSRYWIAYLLALALSGLFGGLVEKRAWLAGLLLIYAQLPVMLISAGTGPLIIAGILLLAILSLPAALIAAAASWIRRRAGRGRNLNTRS